MQQRAGADRRAPSPPRSAARSETSRRSSATRKAQKSAEKTRRSMGVVFRARLRRHHGRGPDRPRRSPRRGARGGDPASARDATAPRCRIPRPRSRSPRSGRRPRARRRAAQRRTSATAWWCWLFTGPGASPSRRASREPRSTARPWRPSRLRKAVGARLREVARDVVDQLASALQREQLHAVADREHGQPARECGGEQGLVEGELAGGNRLESDLRRDTDPAAGSRRRRGSAARRAGARARSRPLAAAAGSASRPPAPARRRTTSRGTRTRGWDASGRARPDTAKCR